MNAANRLERLQDAARDDPEAFWGSVADEFVHWSRKPSRVFVDEPPTFRWFEGGLTNIAWSAVDRNIEEGRGDQVAIIGADERGGRRSVTYHELLELVRRIAAALRGLGVGRGDRVTIYMPTTIEAIATMLAAARIGAIHSVVFEIGRAHV